MRIALFRLALSAVLAVALLAPGAAGAATTCPGGTQYSSAVLGNTGLAGYWRLGDTSGTQACDGKGTNPGTYAGGFTLNQAGALAGDADAATAFNGTTGAVSVPSATALNTLDTFSIEAWTRRGALGTTQVIASKQGTSWTLLFNAANNLVLQQNGVNIVASTVTSPTPRPGTTSWRPRAAPRRSSISTAPTAPERSRTRRSQTTRTRC